MNPSPVTVTSVFVRASPSYSLVSVADVIVTLLLLIVRVPVCGVTANSSDTSFPSLSLTTAVPLTLTV